MDQLAEILDISPDYVVVVTVIIALLIVICTLVAISKCVQRREKMKEGGIVVTGTYSICQWPIFVGLRVLDLGVGNLSVLFLV